MLKAKVNNKEYNIDIISDNELELNQNKIELDIISLSKNKKHILFNNKSYTIEEVDYDEEKKIATIKVNNNSYQIALKDKYDILLKELGMNILTSKVVKELKAPMPGLVVSVEVIKGQNVLEGEALLILEAMKMENVLKSPIEGIIKSIKVSQSETVEKNQILIEFE